MSLKAFIHGLNIYNLTKPQQVDDLIPPDPTPTNVANGRLEQIRRNAADDYSTAQSDMLDDARKEAKQNRLAALHLAADRVALYKTLQFIEQRWRSGANAEQTLSEAQRFRSNEYDEIMNNSYRQYKLKDGIKTLPRDKYKVRDLLVDSLPVGKGPRS